MPRFEVINRGCPCARTPEDQVSSKWRINPQGLLRPSPWIFTTPRLRRDDDALPLIRDNARNRPPKP